MITPGTAVGIAVAVANVKHLLLALPGMEIPHVYDHLLYCFLPSEHRGRAPFSFYNFKASQYLKNCWELF